MSGIATPLPRSEIGPPRREPHGKDRPRSRRPGAIRLSAFLIAIAALLVAVWLSLSVGSNPIPLGHVWRLMMHPDGSQESVVVHQLRIPRTVTGIVVGLALGLAGALTQSLTRNPLADPGILGVNAGAALAVVLAVAVADVYGIWFYLWFAFAGALLASIAVYLLGATGQHTATPVRLALAGVAITAALTALTQAIILGNQRAFNEFRFWVAGSLEGRGGQVLEATGPFIAVGVLLALALGPSLNALALGEDTGRALGVRIRRTRLLAMLAVTLLCGAGTAAAGPIAFVGLAVPYVARALVGSDQRWVTVFCVLVGPAWLLGADVLARVVIAPQETQVGIIAALSGAPVFVAIVRRRTVAAL